MVNRSAREEPDERARLEAVRDLQAGRGGGVCEGQEQEGSGWGRRGHGRAVRAGGEEQPVQAVEPDVVGKLLSRPGAVGGDPQEWGSGDEGPRSAYRSRSNSADGGGGLSGAVGGTGVSPGLLRLPAGPLAA